MARPKTKTELIEAANTNYDKLWNVIDAMPEIVLNTDFDFSQDTKKKEAHWKRDQNLRDILIHLYEWHQLLIKWIDANLAGKPQAFLPAPYNWKTYGDMNVEFWEKHQVTPLSDAKKMFISSHKEVLKHIQQFSDEALFSKQYYNWTGTTTLGSYCVSATSSHYDWAIKKLRAHIKNINS